MSVISFFWKDGLTGTGMLLLLMVLTLLVYLFKNYIKKEKPQAESLQPVVSEEKSLLTAAEEAAVAMALHLFYQNVHDEESGVITIQEKQSSWNSKIYGLNNRV